MTKWKVLDSDTNTIRHIEVESFGERYGYRMTTVANDEIETTDWRKWGTISAIGPLIRALEHFEVTLDDSVNSLAGDHKITTVFRTPQNQAEYIAVKIWRLLDSPMYVWVATHTLLNGMTMESPISSGSDSSCLALLDVLKAFNLSAFHVYQFTPSERQQGWGETM